MPVPSHSEGYVRITVDGRRVYQHRYLARQWWPEVEQECRYCGRIVSWELRAPNPAALIVDHRDHDRTNNTRPNLVPCCGKCNLERKVTRSQQVASGGS